MGVMMRLFCRNDHYKIVGGQIFLTSKSKRQRALAHKMIDTLEKQIRQQVFVDICEMKLLDNRKAIVKHGIDNAVLMTQDLCARRALKNNPSPFGQNAAGEPITGILNGTETQP